MPSLPCPANAREEHPPAPHAPAPPASQDAPEDDAAGDHERLKAWYASRPALALHLESEGFPAPPRPSALYCEVAERSMARRLEPIGFLFLGGDL